MRGRERVVELRGGTDLRLARKVDIVKWKVNRELEDGHREIEGIRSKSSRAHSCGGVTLQRSRLATSLNQQTDLQRVRTIDNIRCKEVDLEQNLEAEEGYREIEGIRCDRSKSANAHCCGGVTHEGSLSATPTNLDLLVSVASGLPSFTDWYQFEERATMSGIIHFSLRKAVITYSKQFPPRLQSPLWERWGDMKSAVSHCINIAMACCIESEDYFCARNSVVGADSKRPLEEQRLFLKWLALQYLVQLSLHIARQRTPGPHWNKASRSHRRKAFQAFFCLLDAHVSCPTLFHPWERLEFLQQLRPQDTSKF